MESVLLSKMMRMYTNNDLPPETEYFYKIPGKVVFNQTTFNGILCSKKGEILLENVRFKKCIFVNCNLVGIKFKNCEFYECVFNFSSILRCPFEYCKIDSLEFVYTHSENISFNTCKLECVSAYNSKLDFTLTKSRLKRSSIELSRFVILLKKLSTIDGMAIEESKLEMYFEEKNCKLKYIDIYSSSVSMKSSLLFNEDEIDVGTIRLTHSDIYSNMIIGTKNIVEYIYCFNCSCNGSLKRNPVNVGPIGSRGEFTTYFPDKDIVRCGCWAISVSDKLPTGTLRQFESRVNEVYGENGEIPDKLYYSQYMNVIAYFKMERDRYLKSLK